MGNHQKLLFLFCNASLYERTYCASAIMKTDPGKPVIFNERARQEKRTRVYNSPHYGREERALALERPFLGACAPV
jgi:hypothetical protein